MEQIKHYKILESLGSGGMGTVYRAFDSILEREVAVKVMHPHLLQDPNNAERLLQEARAAAKLAHPNIVTIYEIGEAESGRYIAMEYAQGVPLNELLRENGPLEWKRAVRLGSEILAGLEAAHKLEIIHRDIKTDNILVTGDDHIKILDFGIAKFTAQAGITASGDILGTVEYMAPEQMLGEKIDARCDVYAAGVVLYQLLTNRMPLAGDSVISLLYKKLNEEPVPPSFYSQEIAAALDDAILKAIRSTKEERWESAQNFSDALLRLLDKKAAPESMPHSDDFGVSSGPDEIADQPLLAPEAKIFHSVFVGRKDEFQKLRAIYELAERGQGQTAIIHGEAGVGKSTLAAYFRKHVERKGAWVLYGACLYQVGMDAYLPFIDALRGFFNNESHALPEKDRLQIKAVVREKVPLLLEFTERFTTSFGQTNLLHQKEDQTRQINLFEGINLLISLLSTIRPVVLIIDDLQWADEASLQLFHYLARHLTKNQILQLAICRTDRYDLHKDGKPTVVVDVLSRLRQEGIATELKIGRFEREDCDRLIDQTLKKTIFSDDFYQHVYTETRGNPFFVLETLKMLQENGGIFLKEGAWFDKQDLKRLVVPSRVEDVFVRRLNGLNGDEREILQVAAVIGTKFDVSVLTMILEMSKIKLLKILQKIQHDLQILTSMEDGFQFDHPMLRELLYNEIPHALRREYHLLIADRLEAMYNGNLGAMVGEVAEHLRRGNNHKKAIPLLYQAALRAYRLSAYKEASLFFEHLQESLQTGDETLPEDISAGELNLKLGVCYEEIGRWEDARSNYRKLLALGENSADAGIQIEALNRMGRLYVKTGEWDEALEKYERCLHLLELQPVSNMRSRITNNIGVVYFQKGELDLALEYFKRTIDEAETGDGDFDKAHAFTNIGSILNIKREHQSALQNYQKALEIYQQKDHRKNQAQVFHNIGMCYSDLGKWQESIEAYEKCTAIADKIEDKGLIALTNLNVGKAYLRQGDHKIAKKHADKALKFFKRVSDTLSVAEIYQIYGQILGEQGQFEKAEKFLSESIQMNREKQYQEGLAHSCEVYADVCLKYGQFQKAYENYLIASETYGRMNLREKSEELDEKISALQDKIPLEIKQEVADVR